MLENIIAFTRVIDKQGFAKAAKDLGISTPVVTRRINELEKELGIKLIQRSTRKLSITEAGQLFYDRCKEIIYSLEAAKLAITSMKDEISGTIKIGMPASINHLYFTPGLPQLLKKYPYLKVEIIQGNHLLDLLDKGFDLVLHCGNLPDSSYHYRKLSEWTKITCAAPSYFKKNKKPKTPRDLEKYNRLDHADNRTHTWTYNIDSKAQPFLISGNVKINNSSDLKNLALSGLGIVYLPSFTVLSELNNGSLVSILDEFNPEPLGIYVIYPSKQFMNKKTRLLIDFLQSILASFLKKA